MPSKAIVLLSWLKDTNIVFSLNSSFYITLAALSRLKDLCQLSVELLSTYSAIFSTLLLSSGNVDNHWDVILS